MPVIAYHVIFTAYGFWLPNDPRGSWSDFVRVWELLRFGEATKTDARRSVASATHDRRLRREAKAAMAHPPVQFTGVQARAIGAGFADYVRRVGLAVYACSIMPDHVHMVIGRHTCDIEQVVGRLKQAGTTAMNDAGLNPMTGRRERSGSIPSPWARKCWKVYLFSPADIRRSIAYVAGNPMREGLPAQRWTFVTAYGG